MATYLTERTDPYVPRRQQKKNPRQQHVNAIHIRVDLHKKGSGEFPTLRLQSIICCAILLIYFAFPAGTCATPSQMPYTANNPGEAISLTPDEQAFIALNQPLIFSEVNWKPLSIVNNPQGFDGIIADYMNIITRRSGLKFSFQRSDTWAEVLHKYADRKIDVVPALALDDMIGRDILLSEPFITFPLVIVTREDIPFIQDTFMLNGKMVAVGKGYTSYHFLNKNYPEITTIQVEDVKEALIKVSNGEVFAFVDTWP